MKYKALVVALAACMASSIEAAGSVESQIATLQKQTEKLQAQLQQLQKELVAQKQAAGRTNHQPAVAKSQSTPQKTATPRTSSVPKATSSTAFHIAEVQVHTPNEQPESRTFYPTALVADGRVLTYIAGTPVVTSPYLGSRPAFDGSDYIVNISSINRDIRLMQQRRRLYAAYQEIGYKSPMMPIMALSGKVEPVGYVTRPYSGDTTGDLTLGSSELDVAAAVNRDVEAFISIGYNELPEFIGGTRVDRSPFYLNMGFINIGDLDKTPFYFTAGQLYVPYGRYSSGMVSAPLTMILARTKSRPFILGYKTMEETGPFAALYAFKSETTQGKSGVGGVNLGTTFAPHRDLSGEVGISYIGTIADSAGMQWNSASPNTTFGGFASPTNGSEAVSKVPGGGVHGYVNFERYTLTAEWVGALSAFSPAALSYNNAGARPQAIQLEAGMTFMNFAKPASLNVGYQWSKDALALLIPRSRISGVYSISIWKDTVESLEYRHDIDYGQNQFANGIAPVGVVNQPIQGTGKTSDTLLAQIGVFF